MGDFEKKISCKPLSEEKNCMQYKCNREKFLHCCKKEKKCCKAISSFWGALQIKLQPFSSLAPFELWIIFGDAAELLLYMGNELLAYHKQ